MCVCVGQPTLIRLIQESAVEFRTTRKNDWVQSELVQDAALLIIHKLFIVIHRAVLVRHQGLRTVKLSLIVFFNGRFHSELMFYALIYSRSSVFSCSCFCSVLHLIFRLVSNAFHFLDNYGNECFSL